MELIQDDRLIRMTKGPLSPTEVLVTSFSGHESMSRLFQFDLEFVSTKLDLKASDLVGKEVNIEIDRRDASGTPLAPRHFHGYFSRFTALDVALDTTGQFKYRNYRAEMVPWLWFLGLTARCFIFFPEKEDKTVYEVIEAVLQRVDGELHVSPSFDTSGIGDLKKRTLKHCVQYRETDLNFLSRMLEQFGAFYYFKHSDGEHKMFVSMKTNYPKCDESEVTFPSDTGSQTQLDHIKSWEHSYEFVSGKWAHTDYNFQTPSTRLATDSAKISVDVNEAARYEVYDYPGEYAVKGDGETEARIRQEEEEIEHNVVHASSLCRTFMPGHVFQLKDHPDQDVVSEHQMPFLITAIQHFATQQMLESDTVSDYQNSFTCIPSILQFRAARATPKPSVTGVQTAVVVGPAGEEIYPDQFGRVKVQFHWDRIGAYDENSSCWIRVSQLHAGKGFGGVDLPRIGDEVIVDFLEGDPDRPIIIGRVYHKENMPPYGLPDSKNISGMKSNSTKGGGGYNEFVMDDTKNKELIRLHAQYDMDSTIEHDMREHVLNDRSRDVTNNETITIGNSRTETVQKGDETVTVDKGKRTINVNTKDDTLNVLTGNQVVNVNTGNASLNVSSADRLVTVEKGNYSLNAKKVISFSAQDQISAVGNNAVSISGKKISITATEEITIGVGSSNITIKPDGISTGATKITSAAVGAHDISGALIKIN